MSRSVIRQAWEDMEAAKLRFMILAKEISPHQLEELKNELKASGWVFEDLDEPSPYLEKLRYNNDPYNWKRFPKTVEVEEIDRRLDDVLYWIDRYERESAGAIRRRMRDVSY